jgi:Arc/MetJ-type ribon-helix-helix transcriptional regulator
VTPPAKLARTVEAKVASDEAASESEVVTSGLEALAADEEAPAGEEEQIERRLREEEKVAPTCETLKRDPLRAIPLDEAKKRIGACIAGWNEATGDG